MTSVNSKIELPPNPDIEGLKIVDLIVTEINNDVFEDHMHKSCKKGHYYCYTDKKCKKIPSGYQVVLFKMMMIRMKMTLMVMVAMVMVVMVVEWVRT